MRDIRPIRSEADLTWALDEVAAYFESQPEPGTPEADRFDVLAALIEAYETRFHAISAADPVDVLRHAIDDMGRSQKELADILGSAPRASEILSGKRSLTLEMIQTISDAWRIPVAALMPRRGQRARAA